jgi:hypothetical protein
MYYGNGMGCDSEMLFSTTRVMKQGIYMHEDGCKQRIFILCVLMECQNDVLFIVCGKSLNNYDDCYCKCRRNNYFV